MDGTVAQAGHTTPLSSSHPPEQHNSPYHDNVAQATAAAALSEQGMPAATTTGRKRKATGQPGSRGVANLTPEQLAKKRANDREAQRAIRERTRNTIEGLAARIKELESQQPYLELQKVVAERDRALAEVEELKRRLAQVASVVALPQPERQPNLHGMCDDFGEFIEIDMLTDDDDAELATLTAQQSPLPPLSAPPQCPPQQSPLGPGYEQQHIHPDLRSIHSGASPTSHISTPGTSVYQENARRWSPSLEQPAQSYPQSNGSPYEQRPPPRAPMQSQSNGERLGLAYVLEPTSNRTPSVTSAPYHSPQTVEAPLSVRLPKNFTATCPLDSLLLDFMAGRKRQLVAGAPMQEVAGPEDPDLRSLQHPEATHTHTYHPVFAFLYDILSKFPGIANLPEKVAVLYIMFLILKWQICPCERCYLRMPEWVRPLNVQLEVGHAAWHDHLPWPSLRRNLIAAQQSKPVIFDDFFIPYCNKLSLNWPYPNDQVLVTRGGGHGEEPTVVMNPVFETHLRELRNWSLGSEFRQTFPFLVDETVKITDTPRRGS